jgi:hypothetical protein
VTQSVKDLRSTEYATRSDFCRIYVEQMNSLYLLSLLLTADPQEAEQCFLSGFEDSVSSTYVFKESAHLWTFPPFPRRLGNPANRVRKSLEEEEL